MADLTPTAWCLPPLNIAAINDDDARFGIAESVLTSSTVPETPPAAYNAGTTYASGAQVSTGTAGGVISVYTSLQAGNIGHTPASSPTWWKFSGYTWAAYAGGTTYAAGDHVLDATAHLVYESLVGSNTGNPLTDATKWAEHSTTNRWAMFDMLRASGTVEAVSPLTIVLAPGRITSLGLTGIDADTLTVTLVDGATTVYSETINLDGSIIASWEDYFFGAFRTQSIQTLLEIPTYTAGVLTITLTKTTGSISLGKCVVGTAIPLGVTEKSPDVRRTNFSSLVRDTAGQLTDITRRKIVRRVTQRVAVELANVRTVDALFDDVLYSPALWIGLDDFDNDYAYLLAFLGCLMDSRIDPAEVQVAWTTLEIEGI